MNTMQFPFKTTHNIAEKGIFKISYSDNSKVKEVTNFVGPENDKIHGCKDFVLLTHFEDGNSLLISCTNDFVVLWATKKIEFINGEYVI